MIPVLYSGLFPWGAKFHDFRGSPDVTNFSAQCINTVYTCSNFDRRCFVMAHFSYLHSIDSILDIQDPLSQAVPRVMAEEVNRAV